MGYGNWGHRANEERMVRAVSKYYKLDLWYDPTRPPDDTEPYDAIYGVDGKQMFMAEAKYREYYPKHSPPGMPEHRWPRPDVFVDHNKIERLNDAADEAGLVPIYIVRIPLGDGGEEILSMEANREKVCCHRFGYMTLRNPRDKNDINDPGYFVDLSAFKLVVRSIGERAA